MNINDLKTALANNASVKYAFFESEKLNLYTLNLMGFIDGQPASRIIDIDHDSFEQIDYVIGILFLTEMNRYCKINKMSIHGYYLAYFMMGLFHAIRNPQQKSNPLNYSTHFITMLCSNMNYMNDRVDPSNSVKNIINQNQSRLLIKVFPIVNYISENLSASTTMCSTTLSKFFYVLLQTAKFMGSGNYDEPNLLRLSEYYTNIFYSWMYSTNQMTPDESIEFYDNYLSYKNKLIYSLIELNLSSETIDVLIAHVDRQIVKNIH